MVVGVNRSYYDRLLATQELYTTMTITASVVFRFHYFEHGNNDNNVLYLFNINILYYYIYIRYEGLQNLGDVLEIDNFVC